MRPTAAENNLMPMNPNEIINGSQRRLWLVHAARAIIAVTDPKARFLILRAGFINFQTASKVEFREMADFNFDSNELRFIWEYIGKWVFQHERRLQPQFEELYQQLLHKNPDQRKEDGPEPDDYIVTENITDGMLKRRVH